MLELRLPLDYEQLPEYWQLQTALARQARPGKTPKEVEQSTCFVFHRLFVTLGYNARSTNQPGLLNEIGSEQFLRSLDPLFGDDVKLLDLLTPYLLRPAPEGWYCDLFARMNPHLARDFKPAHEKGNVNSRLSAAHKKYIATAEQQGSLLPPEIYKKRDGAQMNDVESRRCIIFIRMIDRSLFLPQRPDREFTEGVMATAFEVTDKHDAESLRQFYYWLGNNHKHPIIPKAADQLIQDFEKYFAMQNQNSNL